MQNQINAVEQNAAHPLARAIVQTALARGLTLPETHNAQTEAGAGIRAEIDGIGEIIPIGPTIASLALIIGPGFIFDLGKTIG